MWIYMELTRGHCAIYRHELFLWVVAVTNSIPQVQEQALARECARAFAATVPCGSHCCPQKGSTRGHKLIQKTLTRLVCQHFFLLVACCLSLLGFWQAPGIQTHTATSWTWLTAPMTGKSNFRQLLASWKIWVRALSGSEAAFLSSLITIHSRRSLLYSHRLYIRA